MAAVVGVAPREEDGVTVAEAAALTGLPLALPPFGWGTRRKEDRLMASAEGGVTPRGGVAGGGGDCG